MSRPKITPKITTRTEELGTRVELKYCEGCGGLQMRPVGSGVVFCLPCEAKMAREEIYVAVPVRRKRRAPRLPRNGGIELQARSDSRVSFILGRCA